MSLGGAVNVIAARLETGKEVVEFGPRLTEALG
jgi:hypothetical protein